MGHFIICGLAIEAILTKEKLNQTGNELQLIDSYCDALILAYTDTKSYCCYRVIALQKNK